MGEWAAEDWHRLFREHGALKLAVIEKERVRRALREAFAGWRKDPESLPLTHEQCVDMRTKLLSVRSEDIPYCLPQILEDLLDTHTGKPGNPDYAESVVDFLDVPTVSLDADFLTDRFGKEGFENTRAQEEDLRSVKYSQLSGITTIQARALCEWLKYARTWSDLEWDIEQLDSAYAYWSDRAKNV